MYIPSHFEEKNIEKAYEIIDQYGFATLVSPHDDTRENNPYITHLPFLRDGNILLGHVARPNKHWKRFEDKTLHTVIFQGAHGYISPRWFETKDQVPTWAYAIVHVTGVINIIDDVKEINNFMKKLSYQYEGAKGWSPSEVDSRKYEALKRGIVCFKMEISDIQCKLKLNQNKPEIDQKSVLSILKDQGDEPALVKDISNVMAPS
ncbi:FMN-binding negative transcriptional regulator [Curvivirga aplysinae]|uniref:FMN-binding negative transcriptional regulator n=1 Tax=Curvivirga aplysinae TaxID=2529852 RepID=UPI0012BC7C2F|nr:FMN-binding negative transcriptional regulator [Curvivirga aplysinae]MTI08982.1 FMN-binding negative transcriptional regulator [Curvivirga aplysinae]